MVGPTIRILYSSTPPPPCLPPHLPLIPAHPPLSLSPSTALSLDRYPPSAALFTFLDGGTALAYALPDTTLEEV
jgi:hypothetical protein